MNWYYLAAIYIAGVYVTTYLAGVFNWDFEDSPGPAVGVMFWPLVAIFWVLVGIFYFPVNLLVLCYKHGNKGQGL